MNHEMKIFRAIVMNRALICIDKYVRYHIDYSNNDALSTIKNTFHLNCHNILSNSNDDQILCEIRKIPKTPYTKQLAQDLIYYCLNDIVCLMFDNSYDRFVDIHDKPCRVFYCYADKLYRDIGYVISTLLLIKPGMFLESHIKSVTERLLFDVQYKIFILRELRTQIVDDVIDQIIHFLIMFI